MKFLRIALVPNAPNYIVCIACGRFGCDYSISNGSEPEAGLHKRCLDRVKIKRVSRTNGAQP